MSRLWSTTTGRHQAIAAAAITVTLVGTGAAFGHAATGTSHSRIVNACYQTSTRALMLHNVTGKPSTYQCKAGERPISWNEQGQRGPNGVVHQYFGSGFQGANPVLHKTARVLAETVKLPAGRYAVEGSLDVNGQSGEGVICWAGIVSGFPKPSLEVQSDQDAIVVVTVLNHLTAQRGDRIALYCRTDFDYGSDISASDATISALPVSITTTTTVP